MYNIQLGEGGFIVYNGDKPGMTKEFQSSKQILDRMQSTNSRFAGNFTLDGMPSLLKKLRREGKIENDEDNLEVWRLVNG